MINECIKKKIYVSLVPGPSAVSGAVSVSGFSDKFFFYGFPPEKKKTINEDFQVLSKLNSSIVFFVSAKKFNKVIPTFKKYFSGRKILICKEMTKFYEEFIREEIDNLKNFEENLRGELTLVISEMKKIKISSQKLSESDKDIIKSTINKLSIKEIIESILLAALGSKSGSIMPRFLKSSCIDAIYLSVNSAASIFNSLALAIILSSTSVIFLM